MCIKLNCIFYFEALTRTRVKALLWSNKRLLLHRYLISIFCYLEPDTLFEKGIATETIHAEGNISSDNMAASFNKVLMHLPMSTAEYRLLKSFKDPSSHPDGLRRVLIKITA